MYKQFDQKSVRVLCEIDLPVHWLSCVVLEP
jgi:hypothetical protein